MDEMVNMTQLHQTCCGLCIYGHGLASSIQSHEAAAAPYLAHHGCKQQHEEQLRPSDLMRKIQPLLFMNRTIQIDQLIDMRLTHFRLLWLARKLVKVVENYDLQQTQNSCNGKPLS